MRLAALNETIAAFTTEGPTAEADPRAALNKLMTVKSWRQLIEFLKGEGCNDLFAKREAKPLVDRFNEDPYGDDEGFCYEELSGSLKARIDKDNSIDYLDDLSKADLLQQGDVYELYIPELMSYSDEISNLLTLAAVALGANPPDDLAVDFDFSQVECDFDETFIPAFNKMVDDLFGDHGQIALMSLNRRYWPESGFGPYLSEDAPFEVKLFRDELKKYQWERHAGVIACRAYFGKDHNGEDQDYDIFIYDTSRYSHADAIRMLCGIIVAHTQGDTTLMPTFGWEDERTFDHDYLDEPDYQTGIRFSLDGGFEHPIVDEYGFKRWQLAVQETAEAAIFDGRVALCPICNTPIITKSHQSRIEYCCESHKTIASKRRRERAHQLYQMGTPIEDAIKEIGPEYRASIKKWYAEAEAFANPAR